MLFDAVAKGVAADAKKPSGTGLVAIHLRERFGQQSSLVFFQRAESNRRRLIPNRERAVFAADKLGQIADVDHRTHHHDAYVANHVFEFADVSWPIVLAKK